MVGRSRFRANKTFFLLHTIAALAVASAQQPAAQDTAPPPPGRLIDIGGWKLHLNCTGNQIDGRPTVVFESGAGGTSLDWYFVQQGVSEFTRACSYDRAGTAWSDAGPHPRTIRQMEYELQTLLAKAGMGGPLVLVGHSFGGVMVRNFQLQFPADVSGMVLVDPSSDDTRLVHFGKLVRMRELDSGKPIPPVRSTISASDRTLSAGPTPMVARAAPPAAAIAAGPSARSQQTLGATLPPEIRRLRAWAAGQIERGTVDSDGQFTGQEFAELYRARLAHAYMFGDMPLIVIIARKRQIPQNLPPEWAVPNEEIDHQDEELASLSRQGRFIYAENSTHMVPDDEPSVVIKAIHEVVDASAAARKN